MRHREAIATGIDDGVAAMHVPPAASLTIVIGLRAALVDLSEGECVTTVTNVRDLGGDRAAS